MRWIFIILLSFNVHAELTGVRQKQLDSIVTNIDKDDLRNLDSLHRSLHNKGANDEERVFLFYGLFATHYKYDEKRAGSNKTAEYTPYYTAYRKSGVCRDFAALFCELCKRSQIPCVEASGRVKVSLFKSINAFFHLRLKKANHAWNVVKYNDQWHLMDPTWSMVARTEKYYGKDKNGRKKYLGKVKIPTRNYYNTPTDVFYTKRNAVHPSFYTNAIVYTFKSSFKKAKRKVVSADPYNYEAILDSLSSNPYFQFSRNFIDETKNYSKDPYLTRCLANYWGFLQLKRSIYNPLTVSSCENHLKEFKLILDIIKQELNTDYSAQFKEHTLKVNKTIDKLKRKATT